MAFRRPCRWLLLGTAKFTSLVLALLMILLFWDMSRSYLEDRGGDSVVVTEIARTSGHDAVGDHMRFSGERRLTKRLSGSDGATSRTLGSQQPSIMTLAAQYVTIDISYLRWLWWPIILYLFWGMGYLCDNYFVRTIEVFSERFDIPDDVAGATLMALGCNGPEMSLNIIGIFHPSSIGTGAVIGGEVFNVLVIIGTAILATPAEYMPLKLGLFSFCRDTTFYTLSVFLLYWVLCDGQVTRVKALVLLSGAVFYSLTVMYSQHMRAWMAKGLKAAKGRRASQAGFQHQLSRAATIKSNADDIDHQMSHNSSTSEWTRQLSTDSNHFGHRLSVISETLSQFVSDDEFECDDTNEIMLEAWREARHTKDPREGSVLSVRVNCHSRLMDRAHRSEERFFVLQDNALLASTVLNPEKDNRGNAASGVVYDYDDHTAHHHWHHGGLVNRPVYLEHLTDGLNAPPASDYSRPFLPETKTRAVTGLSLEEMPSAVKTMELNDAPWEVIPLEDILYCEPPADRSSVRRSSSPSRDLVFSVHVHQHNNDLGSLITLEFTAEDPIVLAAWVESLVSQLKAQRRKLADHAPDDEDLEHLLHECADWLQFPVKLLLKATVPNMDNPKTQHLYPVSFLMCMIWLAIIAFAVTSSCDGIHKDFGISQNVLGSTLAAAGTSFPNVLSGMVVSRQGKTSMAIANALGANVQNVFLALAVPWTIRTCFISQGPFNLYVSDLTPAIVACMLTLLPVVLIYFLNHHTLPRWSGVLFLLMYAAYLFNQIGSQTTGCVVWPLSCS